MGRIGLPELLVVLVIVLLVFGAAKIPQIAKSLGEGIRELKKSMTGADDSDKADKTDKKA
ncbi:MAG: twin-arginine translocase TatA/TatE family subunit [Candidatus Omnitrophota bacterium]